MSMATIRAITGQWNTQYEAMGKSPGIQKLHTLFVEMMMQAMKSETDLMEIRRELAAIHYGKPFTPAPGTTRATTAEAAPTAAANFWATPEGQAKLRQNFPDLWEHGSTASSARRPAPTAESLDYSTPEGLDALKKQWGME